MKLPKLLFAALTVPFLVGAGHGRSRYVEGTCHLPASANPPLTSTIDVDLVDVDGDGDRDLFVIEGTDSPAPRSTLLWINDGTGHYTDETPARLVGLPPVNGTKADAADVDGDGDLDVVIGALGAERLLINDGTGHFVDERNSRLPPPRSLFQDVSADARFADVDADGDADILVANENPFNPAELGGAPEFVWINDGTGHFSDQSWRVPSATDQSAAMVPGDLDGDGDLDLVVLNRGQNRVLINDGTGVFADQTDPRMPQQSWAARAGVLADFDGDGCLDLATANSRDQQNRLYLNNCRGSFVDVTHLTMPTRLDTSTDLDVIDLDGDGDLDLFVSNAGTFSVGHGFDGDRNVFLENDGDGRFRDRTARYFSLDPHPTTDAEFGDVDGDGDADLVIGATGDVDGSERLYLRGR